MNPALAWLLLPALIAPKAPAYRARPVKTARQAKAIAERQTGGLAVSARPIPLNGATGGWEVDLHMPGETKGCRCIVDRDSHTVRARSPIPNPSRPKAHS